MSEQSGWSQGWDLGYATGKATATRWLPLVFFAGGVFGLVLGVLVRGWLS